jgi:N-acetylmuramoyl-L-alanine amidase
MAGLVLAPVVAQPPAPAGNDPIGRLLGRSGPARPATPTQAQAQARPATPAPVVMSARIGEHPDKTRLVLELSDPVALRAFSLSNPNRVVLDLPEVAWRLSNPPVPSGRGVIKAYRYGVFRPGSSRMVIDLSSPVRLAETLVLPPAGGFGYRVVIDLFPTSQTAFESDAGWPADLKKREDDARARVAVAPRAAGKRVVVIDPGHGGIDSGTTGVNGLHEKDLVLAQSLLLARELRAQGFTVHLTRDKDGYVPLRDRVGIARAHKADLFLSVHADAHSDASVSGLSIYTLSDGRSDREAAALARRENQSDVIAGVDLSGATSPVAPILIDLAQRDTLNKSSRFAKSAIAQLAGVTNILPRSPHRSASLAVLVAPDVPAVLLELGFLSNRDDAAQMKTQSWRERMAKGLATAIARHFAGEAATRTAQDARAGTRQ